MWVYNTDFLFKLSIQISRIKKLRIIKKKFLIRHIFNLFRVCGAYYAYPLCLPMRRLMFLRKMFSAIILILFLRYLFVVGLAIFQYRDPYNGLFSSGVSHGEEEIVNFLGDDNIS